MSDFTPDPVSDAPLSLLGRGAGGEGSLHTNGRHPAPTATAPAKRHLRIRPARLLVPVMLALGIILIIRYFEQSTAA